MSFGNQCTKGKKRTAGSAGSATAMRKQKTKGPTDLKSQDIGARKSGKRRASFSLSQIFSGGNDFLVSQQVGCSSICLLCYQSAEAERHDHYRFQQPWLSAG